ncbi:antitoxin Xre/MbcA/ParS toxin-binding domain-containing protein [Lysobacter sp. HA35]
MGTANSHHHAVDVSPGDARSSTEALALDARRAITALGFGAGEVSELLDVDRDTVAKIQAGSARIPPGTDPAATRMLLLVRLHRGLGDVYGSTERMDEWLDTEDPTLHGKPRDLIRTVDGLKRVVSNVEKRCKDCLW